MTNMAMTIPTTLPRPAKPVKDWMSRKEAALYLASLGLPIAAKTLANRAANNNAGKGPPFSRMGWRSVLYNRSDLDRWAKREMIRVE